MFGGSSVYRQIQKLMWTRRRLEWFGHVKRRREDRDDDENGDEDRWDTSERKARDEMTGHCGERFKWVEDKRRMTEDLEAWK